MSDKSDSELGQGSTGSQGTGRRRTPTRTSSFGTAGRINHDASAFYSGRLYDDQLSVTSNLASETKLREDLLDTFHIKSSANMRDEIPDNSIHLMVTSPPYNVGKEYDQDLTLEGYLSLLRDVLREVQRVLVPGGRACINVANLGRRPYIPLHSYIIQIASELKLLMRGEIIWDKGAGAGPSTAWGSWRSPTNPTLRDVHEYILIFCKDTYSRLADGRESTISTEDFLAWTKSVWSFKSESARKIGHPAPFPVELPYRLIQLYTFPGDVILDPFMGSGSTAVAAIRSGRHFVGYDINLQYIAKAQERVQAARANTSTEASSQGKPIQPSPDEIIGRINLRDSEQPASPATEQHGTLVGRRLRDLLPEERERIIALIHEEAKVERWQLLDDKERAVLYERWEHRFGLSHSTIKDRIMKDFDIGLRGRRR